MKYITTVIVLLLATVASAEDTRKWYAMAYPSDGPGAYGVAWNFPTRAAAESAAVAECEKRAGRKCHIRYYDHVDHDHCFAIIRVLSSSRYSRKTTTFFTFQTGPDRFYGADEPPNILFQTEEEARRLATEKVRDANQRNQWQQSSLEFVACSGDPRNRRATQ